MIGGAFANLKWVKPKKKAKALAPDLALLATSPVGQALRDLFADPGLPEPRDPRDKKTPKAEATELLQAAAEVEQALLVEYLYAAYSIDPAAPAAGLRDIVVPIAVEEMGHLITVQNLLRALSEDPYFNRENVPLSGKPAGQYPFPIRFEPFSGDSLAKYVTTECMPLDYIADADLRKQLKPIFDRAEKAADTTVNHVGVLYAKIFWLFQPDDKPHPYWPHLPVDMLPANWHVTDDDLKKGMPDPRQVTANDFGRLPVNPSNPANDDVYVIEIRARDDALFALAQIAAQGEGLQTTINSHFARFFKAYGDFAATFPAGVWSVPVNPNTAAKKLSNAEAEARRITHPKAVRWGRLFDLRYQLLLLELWLGVWTSPPVTGALGRKSLFKAALSEMRARIGSIAGRLLPGMPLKEGDDKLKAGAPFGLPKEELPHTEKTVQARMKQLLADSLTKRASSWACVKQTNPCETR